MSTTYRSLTQQEISALEANGCTASDWNGVSVKDPFRTENYRNVRFCGSVRLGTTEREPSATPVPGIFGAGIEDAVLHNVSVGDNTLIRRVNNLISNVDIAGDCFIENVDSISASDKATFGIATEVSVLNETGGREVPVSESLSAHSAYLMAMYRHDTALTEAFGRIAMAEKTEAAGRRCTIGEGTLIRNTAVITDVCIRPYARIEGATRLVNGTVSSCKEDPVYVGSGVIAQDFIFASGARVEDGAMVLHSFVGQSTHISRLFSAHDSLFFANCTCENGEAAAIFAGPYTVTMHKSSLLIAGMFSFLNAGSGSNQSNHMYKLGPIHQGVVERGSKTTSDSYILWPARIGAFSLVMGRHVSHPDTSLLPFSYLIESHSGSALVPGANLKSVGTIRDAQKWPKRDRRRDPHRLDHINFNLLSPFTVGKMLDAIDLLDQIERTSGPTSETYSYQGMTIKASSLRNGRELYGSAIDKFFGNSVLKRLENRRFSNLQDLHDTLAPTSSAGGGQWVDVSGLLAPVSEIDSVIDGIKNGTLASHTDINAEFGRIAAGYYDMEWTWVTGNFPRWYGKTIGELNFDDIREIGQRWHRAVAAIDNLLEKDARKEFSAVSHTGFGIDDAAERQMDFRAVRGDFDGDAFVEMVRAHKTAKSALLTDLLSRLPAL